MRSSVEHDQVMMNVEPMSRLRYAGTPVIEADRVTGGGPS